MEIGQLVEFHSATGQVCKGRIAGFSATGQTVFLVIWHPGWPDHTTLRSEFISNVTLVESTDDQPQ